MLTYVLVLLFYAGPIGYTDSSVNTSNISGFISFEECVEAGKSIKQAMINKNETIIEYTCIKQTITKRK